MLDITQIEQAYPENLHRFDRGLLREYLQYLILSRIFNHPLSRKLSFLGGTNLRIVHGLPRFSEDIDFDNKDLTEEDFIDLSKHVEKKLSQEGFDVETKVVSHEAFHCSIKFPDLLYQQGLTAHKQEKILIQVDTFDQGVYYQPEIFILNKFGFFDQILVTPKSVILSQKLWTITQRPRLKGRDFFDIMFLLQTVKPDGAFLEAKFGTSQIKKVKESILEHLSDTDYDSLIKDIKPFLLNPNDAEKIKLFPQFLEQEL